MRIWSENPLVSNAAIARRLPEHAEMLSEGKWASHLKLAIVNPGKINQTDKN